MVEVPSPDETPKQSDMSAVPAGTSQYSSTVQKLLDRPASSIPPVLDIAITADIEPEIQYVKQVIQQQSRGAVDVEALNAFLVRCHELNPAFSNECRAAIQSTPPADLGFNRRLRIICDAFNKHICMPKREYFEITAIGRELPLLYRRGLLSNVWEMHQSPYGDAIWMGTVEWKDHTYERAGSGLAWQEFVLLNEQGIDEEYERVQARIRDGANGFADRLRRMNLDLRSLHRKQVNGEELEHAFDLSYERRRSAMLGHGSLTVEMVFGYLSNGGDGVLNSMWQRFAGQDISRDILSLAVAEASGKIGGCLRTMQAAFDRRDLDEAFVLFLLFAEEMAHYRKPALQPGATLSMTDTADAYTISAMRTFRNMGISEVSDAAILAACDAHPVHPAVQGMEMLTMSYSRMIHSHERRKNMLGLASST